jgi:hypothetical protein
MRVEGFSETLLQALLPRPGGHLKGRKERSDWRTRRRRVDGQGLIPCHGFLEFDTQEPVLTVLSITINFDRYWLTPSMKA